MKKLLSLLLVLLCAAVFAAAASAEEMDYTGLLDPYTGMPAETADGRPASDTVQVSDSVIYEQQRGLFLHVVDDQYIMSNVASGMIVTTPVFISVPDGMAATLYRNGEPDARQIQKTAKAFRFDRKDGNWTKQCVKGGAK